MRYYGTYGTTIYWWAPDNLTFGWLDPSLNQWLRAVNIRWSEGYTGMCKRIPDTGVLLKVESLPS